MLISAPDCQEQTGPVLLGSSLFIVTLLISFQQRSATFAKELESTIYHFCLRRPILDRIWMQIRGCECIHAVLSNYFSLKMHLSCTIIRGNKKNGIHLGINTSRLNVTSRFLPASTVSSLDWLCWLSGSKLNAFGSVSVLSLTPFQAAGDCFQGKSRIISVHTTPINRLNPIRPTACFCKPQTSVFVFLFFWEAIYLSCNVEIFCWKQLVLYVQEVRTDVGTQTVFELKIPFLLSLNKGTLARPSAICNSIHFSKSLKGQSILIFVKKEKEKKE